MLYDPKWEREKPEREESPLLKILRITGLTLFLMVLGTSLGSLLAEQIAITFYKEYLFVWQ